MVWKKAEWKARTSRSGESEWTTTYYGVRVVLTQHEERSWSFRAQGTFETPSFRCAVTATGGGPYVSLESAQGHALRSFRTIAYDKLRGMHRKRK